MKIYLDEEYLKRQIKQGKSYLDIAKDNGIGRSTVQRELNRYGLTKPSLMWSPDEIVLLKKHYGKTTDFKKILPNRTSSSIYHKANKMGLKSNMRYREYQKNEEFFSDWTEEMAYVLGWMFSDGNMAPGNRMFRIKLTARDIGILERIKSVLKTETPVRVTGKLSNYAILAVSSRRMCQDLIGLGCTQNKTHRFKTPNVPRKLLRHFVRGYFDGDGSIGFNKPNTIRIRIVGANKQFIYDLTQIFKDELGIPINHKKVRNIWKCEYYGDNARKICGWMYFGCEDLCLERKRNRFKNHLKKRGEYV